MGKRSWGSLFWGTTRDPFSNLGSVQWKAKIGGGIKGVLDLQFIEKFALPVIFDDGKVQMDSNRIAWGSRVISLITKQSPCFHVDLGSAGGKGIHDKRRPSGVSEVCVIGPNLAGWVQGTMGDADVSLVGGARISTGGCGVLFAGTNGRGKIPRR